MIRIFDTIVRPIIRPIIFVRDCTIDVIRKIDDTFSEFTDALGSIGCIEDDDELILEIMAKQEAMRIAKFDPFVFIQIGTRDYFTVQCERHVYNESCPISTEEFEFNTEIAVLTCNHGFIPHHIIEWLYYSTVCPICRCRAEPVESDKIDNLPSTTLPH